MNQKREFASHWWQIRPHVWMCKIQIWTVNEDYSTTTLSSQKHRWNNISVFIYDPEWMMWHLCTVATGAEIVKSWQESLLPRRGKQIQSRDKQWSLLCKGPGDCVCTRSIILRYGWVVVFDLLILRQGFTPVAPALKKQNKVFYLPSQTFYETVQFVLFKANKWR